MSALLMTVVMYSMCTHNIVTRNVMYMFCTSLLLQWFYFLICVSNLNPVFGSSRFIFAHLHSILQSGFSVIKLKHSHIQPRNSKRENSRCITSSQERFRCSPSHTAVMFLFIPYSELKLSNLLVSQHTASMKVTKTPMNTN